MKLYFFKRAGSFAVRIIAHEAGIKLEYESLMELQTVQKKTVNVENFSSISPKNQVPVLVLENGEILTEVMAILIYLAELKNRDDLVQKGSFNKYRVLEWLSYCASELHKNFVPIINPIIPADAKEVYKKIFGSKLKFVERYLEGREFLVSNVFTVADAYLFTILSWLKLIGIEMENLPNIKVYVEKLKLRPSIIASFQSEA